MTLTKQAQEVIIQVIESGLKRIDPWCGGKQQELSYSLNSHHIQDANVTYKGKTYVISYSPAGGIGMGQYPETWTIHSSDNAIKLDNPQTP